MIVVWSDFESSNFLLTYQPAVIDSCNRVDTGHDPMRHVGRSATFDNLVIQIRFTDLFQFHSEIEDVFFKGAVFNAGNSAIAGRSQVRPDKLAKAVQMDSIVIMRTRLDDFISDVSVRPMKHVPIAQNVRAAVVLVKNNATDSSC